MCNWLDNLDGTTAKNRAANAQQTELSQQQAASAAAAAAADAAAAHTTQLVNQDNSTINKDFAQFNPDYYTGYRNAYTGYYTPQVADQYAQAQDQLTAALAGNGTLESSAGAQALANLAKRNTDQVATIQQQADAAVTAQQQAVSAQKTTLYNQANAGVDPTQVAGNATAQTTALAAPQSYTPIGNVFSDLVTPFSNYTKSAANAPVSGVPIANAVLPNAYASSNSANPYGT
jgi:hypothetical protein